MWAGDRRPWLRFESVIISSPVLDYQPSFVILLEIRQVVASNKHSDELGQNKHNQTPTVGCLQNSGTRAQAVLVPNQKSHCRRAQPVVHYTSEFTRRVRRIKEQNHNMAVQDRVSKLFLRHGKMPRVEVGGILEMPFNE